MPALADDATGTGAGVRKPAGKEPAGGGAVAVPRLLWVFGHIAHTGGSEQPMPLTHRIGLIRLEPFVSSFCSAKIVPRFRAVEPHPLQ
jgi:hypothetical protein